MRNKAQDDYDIFVSYASADDRLPAPCNHWVTRFVESLSSTLTYVMGEEPRIYFAPRTSEANHELRDIEAACRKSRIFLAIASPSYLTRDWPKRELGAFLEVAPDPRRLFVVATAPVDADSHPVLGERTHSAFYRASDAKYADSESRVPMPLVPDTGDFFDHLLDLAFSISKYLGQPEDDGDTAPEEKFGPILLAPTTDDLEEEREGVRRFFEQVGIEVLPRAEYPLGGDAFKSAFAEDLARCSHFVQLLGPRPGRRPPDLPEGYVAHQADTARAAGRPMLQWRNLALIPGEIQDAAHRQLLTAETVTASTLEQFKRDARKQITTPPPEPETAKAGKDPKKHIIVFINAEKADEVAARQIKDELGSDYSVFLPLYSAEGSNQKDYGEKLRQCDALLLLYGDAGPVWVESQMLHVVKTLRNDLPPGAICVGPPPENPQVNFSVPGFREVDCRDGAVWRMEPIRELMTQFQ
ncbi:toll/interleukin-1 receptor domain-containing protein [Sphingomonas sp. AOB5]|uniref:toll/interleukin-1 receptor domain-containing protein n=1 Tax=Sphingomonas sp. AOB5 TaxID=3034017 RepID=UPI0023F78176|nr:toll/interleukin-1 receptor domain-containing protein [Sphingomonas sp. AOB5]MDF7775795.1 toll/interleukin-1 receptor domain-containing protein [Sphingomonas sp. AOB5]